MRTLLTTLNYISPYYKQQTSQTPAMNFAPSVDDTLKQPNTLEESKIPLTKELIYVTRKVGDTWQRYVPYLLSGVMAVTGLGAAGKVIGAE